jgi:hypothetical protein
VFQAADQEYEVDADGSHDLVAVRVPVDAWLRFMAVPRVALVAAGAGGPGGGAGSFPTPLFRF